jgi:hypothetical protein
LEYALSNFQEIACPILKGEYEMSRRFAKVLSLLVMPLFLFSTPSTTYAAASDISGHWAEDTLIQWVGQGWLTGNGEGTFNPDKSVTRAEFVTLVNRMKGYKGDADISNFTDVTPDKWYYKEIKAGVDAGYLVGTGSRSIAPDETITRQEAIAMVSRIEGVSGTDASALSYAADGNAVAGWAQKSVAACIDAGYVTGSDGRINPLSNITKAEAIVLLNNVNTKTRSFALAGTYGPTSGKLSATNVNVLTSGVKLRNVAVSGDLVIDEKVGNGDVRIDSVDVNGTLLVKGGGLNSVYVNNSTVAELDVYKSGVRVALGEGTAIKNAVARGGNSILEFGSGTVADNLTILGKDNRITLDSTAVIDAVEVQGDNTKIETEAGSVIKLIIVDADTNIVGNGKILVANVTANLTTETKPDVVNIKGNGDVSIGSATESPVYATPIPPSGNGGGSDSSSTPDPTPTDVPEPEETGTPTPKPEATNTPTPTATPAPASTPAPVEYDIASVEELYDKIEEANTTDASLKLNLTDDFYTNANASGQALEIKSGTIASDITIEGLNKELNVGILVKRDNVTLDGLKIKITDSRKAPAAKLGTSSYYNGILLDKGSGSSLKNVKVVNSNIKIKGTQEFTSGIYVGGKPSSVEITDNEISAVGYVENAVQALLIDTFDKGLTVKGNKLSSTYGTQRTSEAYDAPASAFFIENLLDSASTDASLNISGNTLSSEQYNFFINVLPEDGITTSTGVDALREKDFGLPKSTWSTTGDSFAKAVFDNLVGQVTGKGFAAVLEKIGTTEYVLEQYEIDGKKIEAINYKGWNIVNGKYNTAGTIQKGRTKLSGTDSGTAFKESHPDIDVPIAPPIFTRSFRTRSTTPRSTTPRTRSKRYKVPQTHLESFYK